MIKFQAHGIKTSQGVEKCHYMLSSLVNGKTVITIYGKRYKDFSREVREAFKIENGTEIMTDYFEDDHFRVDRDHPLFNDVCEGFRKNISFRMKARNAKEYAARQLAELDKLQATA